MAGFLLRVLVVAAGLWLASLTLPGVVVRDAGSLLLAALVLGVVNAAVRPVAVILTLPLTIVTLGLFLLVVNAAMVGIVAWLLPGFSVSGFWSALFTSVLVSLMGWMASSFIGPRGRFEVIVIRRRVR